MRGNDDGISLAIAAKSPTEREEAKETLLSGQQPFIYNNVLIEGVKKKRTLKDPCPVLLAMTECPMM